MRLLTPLLLALALSPGAALAQDAADYAQQLAELRAEVEALSAEVELRKEERRAELRSLDAQQTEFEVQLRREEVRLEQLRRSVDERKAELADDEVAAEVLTPVAREGLDLLRELVSEGLPYREDERLAELDRLEAQLDEGVVRPQQAVSRVWQFLEDELRLTRENAPDRQIIDVQGTEVLASVARVGMLSMYFRTDDGRVGRAVRGGEDWTWEVYTERSDVELTNALFDNLVKQIRVGWFELPNALGGAS